MRTASLVAVLTWAAALHLSTAQAQQQEGAPAGKTFRAVLYFVPGSAGTGLQVQHLKEVWAEGEAPEKLAVWLEGGAPQQLQAVTVTPGQESTVVKYKDLTFRITGLYRGPQKERMRIRVSFDQAGQAAVKEFLASLDESVLVRYPLAGAEKGSVVALLVPSG